MLVLISRSIWISISKKTSMNHLNTYLNVKFQHIKRNENVLLQKCYLEEKTADTLELVYNAGCRSNIVSQSWYALRQC